MKYDIISALSPTTEGAMIIRHVPFRHCVVDAGFNEPLLHSARNEWPSLFWDKWFRYDSPLERKSTCSDWTVLPTPCIKLLMRMASFWPSLVFTGHEAIPDSMLWGAGMCTMTEGDFLDVHLDHDVHPKLGLGRKANAILFLDDWPEDWGGRLQFWNDTLTHPVVDVIPKTGRLVLFELSDVSYHGVTKLTCPSGGTRKALMLYFYGLHEGEKKRSRAQFVPVAGEVIDPIKEELRQSRMKEV